MITYVIIYHIINNKNYNIDMSIKYNTIISIAYLQLYQLPVRQKRKGSMIYSIKTSKYILNLSRQEEKRKGYITIIVYIAI